ncbi:MAG: nuclear transport factor 2 family protein [Verrucomicrobia bacterium]|nr:nuclear transport factor 2 family protein [Verrucomicrobiota bacterium]
MKLIPAKVGEGTRESGWGGRLVAMSMPTPRQVVTEWVAAFNSRDAAVAASLYHEDATNIQVAEGEPINGRQAILDSFTSFFSCVPNSYTRIEHIFGDGEWPITEWVGCGTFRR